MKRIMLIILLLPAVFASNLGGFVKNDFIEINDSIASAELIVWSRDQNYTIVLQEKNIPENFRVEIAPRVFSEKDHSDIYIGSTEGSIKAHKASIMIDASNAKPGDYRLAISALLYQPNEKINVVQEREFDIKIKIPGNYTQANASSAAAIEQKNSSAGIDAEKSSSKAIILIVLITIIVVALIIKM